MTLQVTFGGILLHLRSLLKRYKNIIFSKCIWVGNNKTFVKGYENVFIIIIFSSEKNDFSDPIIKIVRILNITFYFFFIYNIILF